jgi:diguanylate cyclase
MQDLTGVRVLVVDDKPEQLEVMSQLFHAAGAQVETAPSAQEALDSIVSHPLDVLVSDIVMPGTDGLALIRKVRSAPAGRAVPAIAVSGLPWEICRAEAMMAGYNEWVAKPFGVGIVDVVSRRCKRRA